MRKETFFPGTKFPSQVIQAASEKLDQYRDYARKHEGRVDFFDLTITRGHSKWTFDLLDDWITEYNANAEAATVSCALPNEFDNWLDFPMFKGIAISLSFVAESGLAGTTVRVYGPDREAVESLMGLFDATTGDPSPTPTALAKSLAGPTVFIGHGRDPSWRDLKDHLIHQHGLTVQAYETGARAGHTIRDILESMLASSAMAILVLTGEDATNSGSVRARQNVVHEAGLFQGRLGWHRAIVVVEDGIELFSNIAGVQQIGFRAGNIRESFGDVVATLRREFGSGIGAS